MKTTILHHEAEGVVHTLLELLGPHCDRIEVAGSYRRRKRIVGDIEIVAIPKQMPNLIGEPGDRPIFEYLDRQVRAKKCGVIRGHQPWAKHSSYRMSGVQVDLYYATPETWGVLLALRTGPVEYSRRIVTERYRGGLLNDGYQVKNGRLCIRNHPDDAVLVEAIDTPEEDDFLAYAGGPIEPHLRM